MGDVSLVIPVAYRNRSSVVPDWLNKGDNAWQMFLPHWLACKECQVWLFCIRGWWRRNGPWIRPSWHSIPSQRACHAGYSGHNVLWPPSYPHSGERLVLLSLRTSWFPRLCCHQLTTRMVMLKPLQFNHGLFPVCICCSNCHTPCWVCACSNEHQSLDAPS